MDKPQNFTPEVQCSNLDESLIIQASKNSEHADVLYIKNGQETYFKGLSHKISDAWKNPGFVFLNQSFDIFSLDLSPNSIGVGVWLQLTFQPFRAYELHCEWV